MARKRLRKNHQKPSKSGSLKKMTSARRRVKAGRQRLGISTEFSFGAKLSPGMDIAKDSRLPIFEKKCQVLLLKSATKNSVLYPS
jgi:hypothetical protein